MSNASAHATTTIMLASKSPLIDARDRVRELLRPAEDAHAVVLDATDLEFISRSAAAELLATVTRWQQAQRTVSWRHIAPPIALMFRAVQPDVVLE